MLMCAAYRPTNQTCRPVASTYNRCQSIDSWAEETRSRATVTRSTLTTSHCATRHNGRSFDDTRPGFCRATAAEFISLSLLAPLACHLGVLCRSSNIFTTRFCFSQLTNELSLSNACLFQRTVAVLRIFRVFALKKLLPTATFLPRDTDVQRSAYVLSTTQRIDVL